MRETLTKRLPAKMNRFGSLSTMKTTVNNDRHPMLIAVERRCRHPFKGDDDDDGLAGEKTIISRRTPAHVFPLEALLSLNPARALPRDQGVLKMTNSLFPEHLQPSVCDPSPY